MATSTCYFLIALVCGAVCNPLGQTTICEAQNHRNGLLQALGSTTVCDATPNLFGWGYGHNLQGAPYLTSYVNGPFCPYGISPRYGSTPVCENVPNVGPGLGVVLGGLGGCSGLSPIIPGPTTVFESTPNLGLGTGCTGYGRTCGLGAKVPGSATVGTCENTPNFGPGLCYGGPYFPNSAGPTTICESITPNLGLEIECNGYEGAGGLGPIVPGSATVCTGDSTPNFGPGLFYEGPYFPNSAGPTTIYESTTPNLNLGIGRNGYGGAGGMSTCDSIPNFGPGLCYGGPYYPNSAGQTSVCDPITPNLGLEIERYGYEEAGGLGPIVPGSATVCTCDSTPNFGPGLFYEGPYFPNSAGPTTIYESTTPNLGLGIGRNGYGGAGGMCTCDSTPNFGPGLCCGGPYYPNSAGQTSVCESITPDLGLGIGCNGYGGAGEVGAIFPGHRAGQINIYDPNVSPGCLYRIPRCNYGCPGLGHGHHSSNTY